MIWSDETNNAVNDARAALFNGGYLRIYTEAFGILLVELRFGSPAFEPSRGGVASSRDIARAEAVADGFAAACRFVRADGVTLIGEGTVGTSGATVNLKATQIVKGDLIYPSNPITLVQR